MGIARNIARLIPNGSGLLPNANIEAMAASKLTGQVPDANAPSGSVINVAYASTSTQFTNSSSTFAGTPLQVTINKQVTNSSILIITSPNVQAYIASAGEGRAGGRIFETTGSRQIFDFSCINRTYDAGGVNVSAPNLCLQCVDSQSGTGNRTYRFDIRNMTGTDARLNIDNNGEATSQISVWEIAP